MILLTASNKSSGSAAVPADRRNSAPAETGSNPGPTLYRQEDDPFLDGVLLDLTAESAPIEEAPPEPIPEAPRPGPEVAPVAPDLIADEPLEPEASEPRRRFRVPVLGISLFALFVAAGAAYSSLRMPIGPGPEATPPAAAEPAAGEGGIVTADLAIPEIDKSQDRLRETEWPAPPPLAPIPGAVSTAALPPPPMPAASAPSPEFTGSIPPPAAAGSATSAVARTAVNMRSGPDRNSPVVSIVAAGTPVEVRSCDFWCDVVVSGQSGWIYQDYLDGPIERRVQ
ncbi:MAG: SH3 domain-containing protein [Bauldia sp.]|nr:SH3 domain-containing protein [Bauldia sp.]